MFKSLQAGRGIAAIGVVLCHIIVLMRLPKYGANEVFGGLPAAGQFGVDYFFVLSGFIIYFAHRSDIGNPRALGNYAWKRFSRVFPIYWVYVTGVFVLLMLGIGDRQFQTGFWDWVTSYALIRITDADSPLGVAWTLYFEVMFYFAFAALILNRYVGTALLIAWVAYLVFFGATSYDNSQNNIIADLGNWYCLNFFFGIAACHLFYKADGAFAWIATIGGIILVLAFFTLWYLGVYDQIGRTRILAGLGFAMLVYGLISLEHEGKLGIPKFLQFLGDASYTIYLAHLPIGSLYMMLVTRLNLIDRFGPEIIYIAGCILVTATASVLYILIEKPLLRALRGRRRTESTSLRSTQSGPPRPGLRST